MTTAGELLARVLRAAGIEAVYGTFFPHLDVVEVADAAVARLLAHAHRRVHRAGAATIGGGALRAGAGELLDVHDPNDLVDVVEHLACGGAIRLGFDLDAPVADVEPPAFTANGPVGATDGAIAALEAARSPIVLAGPGVVADDAVGGLHALAAAGSLGVLNTWGAKGVFDWQSRHHLATAGLQARDFELGGLGDADLVITTGLDPLEAPDAYWRTASASVTDIAPTALASVAERWSRSDVEIAVPPLRAGLAAVTQEGWASTSVPLAPTLVTRQYGAVGSGGGLVAADPGVAGYWVARTFATTELGGVHVPAEADAAGFAAACCIVARLRDPARPVLAVSDQPPTAVLEVARSLGVAVPVEIWSPDGETVDAGAHARRLDDLVRADATTVVTLATDPTQLARMIDVAGDVIAWGGLA